MNKPDEAIDKVLAGLRDAEPPAGLERRILEGLEHRATQRWNWGALVNWAAAGGLALTVLAISLVASTHRVTPQHADQVKPGELATVRPDATSTRSAAIIRAPRAHSVNAKATPVETAMEPGFPAPPMPLTDQEKMLLRLAHRAD